MSLVGKIAVFNGAADMEEKFEPHEMVNSLAPSLIRTWFVESITPEEIEAVRKVIALEKEDIVYCVEAETSCSTEKLPFFIVAEDVTVREGKVFYYERENLKEGERIMAGVKTNT